MLHELCGPKHCMHAPNMKSYDFPVPADIGTLITCAVVSSLALSNLNCTDSKDVAGAHVDEGSVSKTIADEDEGSIKVEI